jgi:hypothetical protein
MSVHGLGIFFPPSEAAMSNHKDLDGKFYRSDVLFAGIGEKPRATMVERAIY